MAVMTTSKAVKLSFADIVKGATEPSPPAPLQPATRGEKRCFCQGEVLVMLGHYGWIMSLDDIDHADVGMNAGRIYVHKRDVVDGDSLAQGDVVSFYLYADDQGLGAECCRLERSAPRGLCADAHEFVPPSWNTSAAEFVPMPTTIPSGLSMDAAEFVPSNFSAVNAKVPEFIPATVWSNAVFSTTSITAINLAFLSDSDDESDEDPVSSGDFDGDKESNGDDTDSSCFDIQDSLQQDSFQQDWDSKSMSEPPAVVLPAPWRKLTQVPSDDDSTSAGAASDSEEDHIVHCAMRAPPGLSLAAGWRAPPGLSLPVLAA